MKGNVSKTKSTPGGEWGQNADCEKIKNRVTEISDKSTDKQYPTAKAVYNSTVNKVDKETGKGLSTNDFTDEDKRNLNTAWIGSQSNLSQISEINMNLENIENQLSTKVDKVTGKDLSSNDYTTAEKNKLSELPSKTELDNDLSGKEDSANKTTTLDSNSTDTQYPSAKCVYDELVKKADMQNSEGGFQAAGGVSTGTGIAIGKDTTPVDNGVVIGRGARAGDGTAIGDGAYASAGGSVGRGAYTHNGGAIGSGAGSFGDGGAVGKGAFTADGFAGGKTAQTENSGMPIDAIQLGTGTNPNAKTLQIYDYQLMDADGHIPNDRMPTKADKTTVTTSTETTASITLADNTEFIFTSDISELTIEFDYSANTLISSVVFNTGETAPEVILPAKSIYYIGTNCGGYNSFTPVANRHYTMIFTYDSNQAICYVSAIPVSQVVLFSAADTNEVTVANDETVAEEPESVTETSESAEEESEPNEVI